MYIVQYILCLHLTNEVSVSKILINQIEHFKVSVLKTKEEREPIALRGLGTLSK